MAKWGLRTKSLMALILACLIALIPAGLVGWRIVDGVRDHFSTAYAENFTLLNKQKVLAPLSRELALSRRLAKSGVTQAFMLDPGNQEKKSAFFREAEGYRADFVDQAYFVAVAKTGEYFFNDPSKPYSDQARYVLSATDPADAWFRKSLVSRDDYNINVANDVRLKETRVWMNMLVRDDAGKGIGLTGASLSLNKFLDDFVRSGGAGVTPMVIDETGAIQAHPNASLIAYNSGVGGADEGRQVFGLVGDEPSRQTLRDSMGAARASPDATAGGWVMLDGKRQLVIVAYIPALKWYVLTAVDVTAARVLDSGWLWSVGLGLGLLVALLLLGFGFAVERLVMRPLGRLQMSARAIADGRYDVSLPKGGMDEIGDLSRAFGLMADKVRTHTAELEDRVRERTLALAQANQDMALAHKKIGDSIDYASLIQRAFLPARQMTQSLGEHHFVLWQPRDVVGGDFYVFRADGENCLLGVVDCAGHGVPGALMTMLARAAIDAAIGEVGLRDPAAILVRTDAALRTMVEDAELPRTLATSMDAGLAYIDRATRTLTFSGAKLSLYASDGQEVVEYPGARRALGSKRPGDFVNVKMDMPAHWTYYLVTDGFLDQAGGDRGYGFGTTRFRTTVLEHASLPLAEQPAAFVRALGAYQGDLPQRDDITMLSFRFE